METQTYITIILGCITVYFLVVNRKLSRKIFQYQKEKDKKEETLKTRRLNLETLSLKKNPMIIMII